MVLLNLLQDYKNRLYDNYVDNNDIKLLENRIKTNEESRNTLDIVLGCEPDNLEFLNKIDLNNLIFLLRFSASQEELNHIKNQLQQLKIVYEGITKDHLDMSYTVEQLQFLKQFRRLVNTETNSLKEKWYELVKDLNLKQSIVNKNDEVEEKIILCEDLIDKIENPDDISFITEFETINSMIVGNVGNPNQLRLALEEIEKYNAYIDKQHQKPNLSTFKIEDFINFMDKNLYAKKDYIAFIDEISQYGDINNMMSVYDLLERLNIRDKFNTRDLISIMLYGNATVVEANYNKIMSTDLNKRIIFEIPSILILGESSDEHKVIKRKNNPKKEEKKEKGNLYAGAHKVSINTILRNKEYLSGLGYQIDEKLKGCQATLQMPSYRIKMNVRQCELYGILNESERILPTISSLLSYDLMNVFDRYIELGLLDYIKNCNSRLVRNDMAVFTRLLKNKIQEGINYPDCVCSHRGLKNEVLSKDGYGVTLDNYQSILDSYGVMDKTNSPYDEVLESTESDEISQELLRSNYIHKLEDTCKTSEYTYQIGNVIISRLKTLRIMETLRKERNFKISDALIYALTYNSFLSPIEYEEIKSTVLFLIEEKGLNSVPGFNR